MPMLSIRYGARAKVWDDIIAQMALSPHQFIDHYEILSLLGSGGMGEVYRARDTRLNRDVAIKVLPQAFATEAARERFQREGRAASALNHPNICAVYDVGEAAGHPYLVMELLHGTTLREHIGGSRKFKMIQKIAEALNNRLLEGGRKLGQALGPNFLAEIGENRRDAVDGADMIGQLLPQLAAVRLPEANCFVLGSSHDAPIR